MSLKPLLLSLALASAWGMFSGDPAPEPSCAGQIFRCKPRDGTGRCSLPRVSSHARRVAVSCTHLSGRHATACTTWACNATGRDAWRTNLFQHLQHSLVGAPMSRAPQGCNARGHARKGVGLAGACSTAVKTILQRFLSVIRNTLESWR